MMFGADVHEQRAGAMASRPYSRRRFLRIATAAAFAAPLLPGCVAVKRGPLAKRVVRANSRLAHACVGVGGSGLADLRNYLAVPGMEVVALCDVDTGHLQRASQLVPAARLYTDWRQMLSAEDEAVDSVGICVPDHMHFAVAYSALRKHKHVMLQTPMCHDVAEVRALTRMAAHTANVTQMAADPNISVHQRQAVEWLRTGIIGEVVRAYISSNGVAASPSFRLPGPRPRGAAPIPPRLDWNLWLGTAPLRFYAPSIYHPASWRSWQDFGTGLPGELGSRMLEPLWAALDLGPARSVHARVQESWLASPERRADTWPQSSHITWTFPAGELVAGGELTVEWFDGDFMPPERVRALYMENPADFPSDATLIVGTRGALLIPANLPPALLPLAQFAGVKLPVVDVYDPCARFAEACLGKEQVESNFLQAGPLNESILLGTIAARVPGEVLKWNEAQMRFENSLQANELLRRTYRSRWHFGPF